MHIATTAALLSLALPIFATVPQIPGWKRIWSDDFNGPDGSLPAKVKWIIDQGTSYPGGAPGWGSYDVQRYTDSTNNLFVSGGNLNIRPLRSSSGKWTSGRIETQRDDFMAQPGGKLKIQARIAMPAVNGANGLGYWPAFWTMGHAFRGNYTNWPMVGEFDIMENVNGLNSVVSGLHCGTNPGGPCNEPSGLTARLACPDGSKCNGVYHTYSVVVDRSTSPERVTFLTDGVQHRVVTSTDIGEGLWNQTIHQGFFIILNVAMGGTYPNYAAGNIETPTSNTVSGKSMVVRYVAVYEQ